MGELGQFKEVSFHISPQLYVALKSFAEKNRGMRHGATYFLAVMLRVAEAHPQFPLYPETPDLFSRNIKFPQKAVLNDRELDALERLSCRCCGCNNSEIARRLVWLGIEFHKKVFGDSDLRLRREEEFFTRVSREITCRWTPLQ